MIDEPEEKRQDRTESLRKGNEKREPQEEKVKPEKKQKNQEERGAKETTAPSSEDFKAVPPHFAGIRATDIEAHGDEEFDYTMVPEEVNEELQANEGEDEEPPTTTD